MTTLPPRAVSKSKFSMYMRTLCDRELYLSLFSNNPKELSKAGIPAPLKSRPGVQIITASGKAFENEQYDELIRTLPNNVIHAKSGRAPVDLEAALNAAKPRTLILQPAINPESYRDFALSNLGVAKDHISIIPRLSDLIPDVVLVAERGERDYEIMPDGTRRHLDANDQRAALCVIDLKNIAEANASYSAEVCLYAFFLSCWLHTQGGTLREQFFVSDRVFLWRHTEMPNFTRVLATAEGGDHANRFAALYEDLRDGAVSYLIYMPAVKKFFCEDLPRVISLGDSKGWDAVEYFVNQKCSSCDWLGVRGWLTNTDRELFDANPTHYCSANAKGNDHLSKMATLSKGATRTLNDGGHTQVATVTGIKSADPVLKGHSLLKKDRNQIAARADAITSGKISVASDAKVCGGLAKFPGAEYGVIVNFDSGSGFLTGIAARGVLFAPYEKRILDAEKKEQGLLVLGDEAFVVAKDNLVAEWAALYAFIDKLAGWIETADKTFADQKLGPLGTQICFWEVRQYEELCNAFGRHLIKILELGPRYQRALMWVFPPPEIIEKTDHVCPNIVFVKDVVTGHIRSPELFAVTLLGTAERYHHQSLVPRKIDNYYVEPLSNAIPRERIFAIWKSMTGTVELFGKQVSIAEGIERYGGVLKAHVWALLSVVGQLRRDLKDSIQGKALPLSMTVPTGLSNVAYDSKLWDRWSRVSAAVANTEGKNAFVTRAEWLESSYKAVILTSLVKDFGNHRYEFEVSEESTEAKLEEHEAYFTIGIVDRPGFPLEKGSTLGLSVAASDSTQLYFPMHRVIAVTLEKFDRVERRAIISFRARSEKYAGAVFDAVMDSGIIPIGKAPIYLLDSAPYDDSDVTTKLLSEIGNPKCATIAPESLKAMGSGAAKKLPKGGDEDTPVARLLWQAKKVAQTAIRSGKEVKALVAFAAEANAHRLNDSQIEAVTACAAQQLSIVWGPPGTGKTDTLVAFLHSAVREEKRPKILISGPNYRTVEEIAGRLFENLNEDLDAACDFYWVYSRTRTPKAAPAAQAHLNLVSMSLDSQSDEFAALAESLSDDDRITIVSTTAQIVQQLVGVLGDGDGLIREAFDIVVLDESSQIPVTLALRPLALLKSSGQLIVAGDHLQMPPIEKIEPPRDAQHLVGSIQNYFIERFGIATQNLLINYRSNQDLVDYAKLLGYPVELASNSPDRELRQMKPIEEAVTSLPEWVPSTSAYAELLQPERRVAALIHEDITSSQANEVEAGIVAGLVYVLRHTMALQLSDSQDAITEFTDDEFFNMGIGIVTPHKAQKALVIRKLIALFPGADPRSIFEAVDTVERFQGGERQTVIVSFGVGDTEIIEGEEAFLLQLERTNVAVSRAKAKCIVVMPKSLAYHLPTDQKAAETAIALKAYLEEFCAHRLKVTIGHNGAERDGEVRWH